MRVEIFTVFRSKITNHEVQKAVQYGKMILEACSYTIGGLFLHKGHGICARPSKCQKRLSDTDLQSFRQKGGQFEWTGGNCNQGGRVKRLARFCAGNRAGNL